MSENIENTEPANDSPEETEEAPEVIAHSAVKIEEGLSAWCGANACGANAAV